MLHKEKLHYIPNKLAANLLYLFLISNVFYLLIFVNAYPIDYWIFAIIMSNVALSLFTFVLIINVKFYHQRWTYAIVPLIIYQIIRFFILYHFLPLKSNTSVIFYNLVLAVGLSSLISAFIISTIRIKQRHAGEGQ